MDTAQTEGSKDYRGFRMDGDRLVLIGCGCEVFQKKKACRHCLGPLYGYLGLKKKPYSKSLSVYLSMQEMEDSNLGLPNLSSSLVERANDWLKDQPHGTHQALIKEYLRQLDE